MEDLTWIDDLNCAVAGDKPVTSRALVTMHICSVTISVVSNGLRKGGEGDSTDYANAVPTISQANLRTSDLTWETTTQTNIGLDLTILNGRLTFNADYYYKKTGTPLEALTRLCLE